MIRTYEIKWLWHDIAAGLVLTSVLVPVGIAYAVASGVPAICGLYATIVGLLAYALAGPSRILVLGPDSSLVTLVLAVTLPLSGGDPERAIALAGMMALVSGAFCLIAGVARLGFITDLLSKPIRYGYMNGIALTVLVSQLPSMLGVSFGDEGLFNELLALFRAVVAGHMNWVSLSLGAGTLVVVLVLKRSSVHTRSTDGGRWNHHCRCGVRPRRACRRRGSGAACPRDCPPSRSLSWRRVTSFPCCLAV